MTRKILLADDSVTIQKVVELTFLEQDLDVVAVGSGDEALAQLDQVQPSLVIADVHMPGADGYEVCRHVKQKSPETPVLLLVGTFEPFDDGAVASSGASGHLKKPFDSQELLRVGLELLGDGPPEPSAESAAPVAEEQDEVAPADAEEIATAVDESVDAAVAAAVEPTQAVGAAEDGDLSNADVERIAKRVVELLSDRAIRDVAWEVVPDLAELLIRDRLRELESQAD